MSRGGARPNSGPARLPDAVKKARGTYNPAKEAWKARQAAAASGGGVRLPVVAVGDPPEELDEAEARWWRVLAAAVDEVGVYTAADGVAFRLLVRSQALLEGAQDGSVMETDREGRPKSVSVSGIVQLTRTVAGLLTRFGLDPSSRDKLRPAAEAPAEAAQEDPDDFEPIQ